MRTSGLCQTVYICVEILALSRFQHDKYSYFYKKLLKLCTKIGAINAQLYIVRIYDAQIRYCTEICIHILHILYI